MTALPEDRYARLDFNSPLSDERAALLIAEAEPTGGERVVDLGCGWGELLLRTVTAAPGATGDGVDTSPYALERGRRNATARGLADRVTFHEAEAASWTGTGYDLAICIGSSHAWPTGTDEALAALREAVVHGGRVIFVRPTGNSRPQPRLWTALARSPTISALSPTWSIGPAPPGSDRCSSRPRAATSGRPSNLGTRAAWNGGYWLTRITRTPPTSGPWSPATATAGSAATGTHSASPTSSWSPSEPTRGSHR